MVQSLQRYFLALPSKEQLGANLTNHLMSTKHVQKVEEAVSTWTSSGSALSTDRRGRPSLSRSILGNHPNLHIWFRSASIVELVSLSAQFALPNIYDNIFSLFCWDLWKGSYTYAGKLYDVCGMLRDSMSRVN
jgi:hypothetical protein